MFRELSAKIADHLCVTAVITEEDKDLYSYIFVILLRTASYIALKFYYAVHGVICFSSFKVNKITLKLQISITLLQRQ